MSCEKEPLTQYKCGNCGEIRTSDEFDHNPDEPHVGDPLCPECNVTAMDEVEATSCPDCGNTEFELTHPTGYATANPTVRCPDCGRTGDVDDGGVWW